MKLREDNLVNLFKTKMNMMLCTEIKEGLARIRRIRFFSHIPFFSVFIVAGALAFLRLLIPEIGELIWSNQVFQLFWGLLWFCGIVSFFLGFTLRYLKCPRCNEYFHVNYNEFIKRNEFTRKCLHCGLGLDGKDV